MVMPCSRSATRPSTQQAEIGMRGAAGGASRLAQRFALVVVEVGGVPKQAPDQRRFAVVDRAAGQHMSERR